MSLQESQIQQTAFLPRVSEEIKIFLIETGLALPRSQQLHFPLLPPVRIKLNGRKLDNFSQVIKNFCHETKHSNSDSKSSFKICQQRRVRKGASNRYRVYKKETMYSVMFRGFFKALKLAYYNIIPRDGYKGIHCFDHRDPRAMEVWQNFCTNVRTTQPDGSIEELLSRKIASFNAENFYLVMGDKFAERFFRFYIDQLVFSQMNPRILNRRFSFQCCKENIHTDKCYESWRRLYLWIKYEMVANAKKIQLKMKKLRSNEEKLN